MQKTLHSEQQGVLLAMLREERQKVGLTQADLAARIGSTQSNVSKCEVGIRRLDVLELRTWLAAIGISLQTFAEELEQRLGRGTSRQM